MTDNTLQSDSLLLTNEEGYVLAVPNSESLLDYEEQGITTCTHEASPAEGNLKRISTFCFFIPLVENTQNAQLKALLKKASKCLNSLPNQILLPVFFNEQVSVLDETILNRYQHCVISRQAVEKYEAEFAQMAHNLKQLESLFSEILPYLQDPNLSRHIQYSKIKQGIWEGYKTEGGKLNTPEQVVDCFLNYTNSQELAYWREVALENPQFLTQSAYKPLYLGMNAQKSLSSIYAPHELQALPTAYLLVAQDPHDKSVCFLQQFEEEQQLYLTTDISSSLGIYFSQQRVLQVFEEASEITFPPNTFYAEYKEGKLKRFHALYEQNLDNCLPMSELNKLNIVLENFHLEKALSNIPSAFEEKANTPKTAIKRLKI